MSNNFEYERTRERNMEEEAIETMSLNGKAEAEAQAHNQEINSFKTLKDLRIVLNENHPEIKKMIDLLDLVDGEKHDAVVYSDKDLRQEAIKIFKNLQGPETVYPLLLNGFPESCKGELTKDLWNKNTSFRYGTEYGMLAMLFWLFNLTEEDVK